MKLKIALIAIPFLVVPLLAAAFFVPRYGILDLLQERQVPKQAINTQEEEGNFDTNGTSTASDANGRKTGVITGPLISSKNISTELASECPAGQFGSPPNCMSELPKPLGVPGAWKMTFHDEFDSKSLDTTKWATQRNANTTPDGKPYNDTIEDGFFTPANVTQQYGTAELSLKQQATGPYQFTSGLLVSNRNFKYGYYEARIKVPSESGTIPAFWLQNTADSTHLPPLIEICKFSLGNQTKPTFNYMWMNKTTPQNYTTDYGASNIDYTKEFHVYGMLWKPEGVQIYLDGKPWINYATATNVIDAAGYMVFSLGIQKGMTAPNGTKMVVDYMRVWE